MGLSETSPPAVARDPSRDLVSNFADALRVIVAGYKRLLLTAGGGAIDFEAIKIARQKSSTKQPRDFVSEAIAVEELVVRLAKVVQARVGALDGRPHFLDNPKDSTHPVVKANRDVVLASEGVPAVELAFLLGITEESVMRHRRQAGREPSLGERRTDTVDTEPANSTLRRLNV